MSCFVAVHCATIILAAFRLGTACCPLSLLYIKRRANLLRTAALEYLQSASATPSRRT